MTDAERRLLTDLRHALLRLHKTLLDWERAAYERIHGRASGHALLQAILSDPQFAWLRPLSELIARIDEARAPETPEQPGDVDALIAGARQLVPPDESPDTYAIRYREALQDHPDAVLAHREVTLLLKQRPDAPLPSQRPH